MGQYYPPQNPYHSPPSAPEADYDEYEYDDDYYDDEDGTRDSLIQRILIFISGGCLVFICMGACFVFSIGLWTLDPTSALFPATLPGSDIGLDFFEPAFPDETVVNDESQQLRLFEVNRNATIPGVPLIEGQETIVITLELVNLSSDTASFSDSDFFLINQNSEQYAISPAAPAVEGYLGRGSLEPNEGIEGRLVFDVRAGEFDLVLEWAGGRDVAPRYMYIE